MNFFKANLGTILNPTMVKNVFGPQYVDDSQKPYKPGNRFEYIDSLPQNSGFVGGTEGKQKNLIRKKYQDVEYINRDIYRLADDLFKNAGVQNRFNSYYTREKTSES